MPAIGSSNAVDSMFNGKLSGVREQTVFTPKTMTDAVKEFFGGSIGYDPCWSPGATTDPEDKVHIDWNTLFSDTEKFCAYALGTERSAVALDLFFCKVRAKDVAKQVVIDRNMIVDYFVNKYGELSGHNKTWPERTFVNPPYGDKGPHASLGTFQDFTETYKKTNNSVIILCPVRSHRKWWRSNVLFSSSAICYLDPVKFEGFPQAFPAPLCLGYKGNDTKLFKDTFDTFGDTDIRR